MSGYESFDDCAVYRFDNDKLALASQTCPVEFKTPKLTPENMMWTSMSDK